MKGENNISRGQLRGYLFEVIISELLYKNGFDKIDLNHEPNDRAREIRKDFIEIKGRGCWHQIDCPFDYNRPVPFSYPLRILGEVKFYKSPLSKKHIREYIGVLKDIQENYFVSDIENPNDVYPRKMEIGVYFSATGFQEEAEKLAYAHGIKTISYSNNCIIDNLKNLIIEIEENYLSVRCMNPDVWSSFKECFLYAIRSGNMNIFNINNNSDFNSFVETQLNERFFELVYRTHISLFNIKSSFIATTATGVFLHFVGPDRFPEELFRETDYGYCRIFYSGDSENRRFGMNIDGDNKHRNFYFTPPESLDNAAIYGGEEVLKEKERLFANLNVNIELNGVSRNIILQIDRYWLYR